MLWLLVFFTIHEANFVTEKNKKLLRRIIPICFPTDGYVSGKNYIIIIVNG